MQVGRFDTAPGMIRRVVLDATKIFPTFGREFCLM